MKREEREKKGKRRWKKRTPDIRKYIRNGRRRIRRRKGLEGGRGSCVGEKHLTAGCTSFMVAHRALLTHLMSTDSIFLSTGIGGIFEPQYTCQITPFGNEYTIRTHCLCLWENWSPINPRLFAAFPVSFPTFFTPISHSLWPSDALLPRAKPTLRILSRWIRVNLENFQSDWLSIFTSLPCKGFLGFVLGLPFLQPNGI